jgi:drug/metabolite transporter (DMT)-like permease
MTQHIPITTHRESRTWVWILVALGANTGWGANPVLLRYLQTVSHLPSMALLLVGNTLVLILMLVVALPRLDMHVFRTRILWLFPPIVVTRAVTHMLAARFTLAIYVQLITLMAPFIVALLSTTLFRERLPPYTGRAITFSLVGALLMMSGYIGQQGIRLALTPTDWWGIGLALASNFFLATYMILVRRTAQHKVPAEAVFMVQLGALVVAASTLSLLLGEDWSRWAALGKTDWLVFAIFTLGILVGANIGQIGALRHLGAPLVSSLLAWRLISALVVAGLLLDERLRSAWQVIGALLVLVTITWYLWQQRVNGVPSTGR